MFQKHWTKERPYCIYKHTSPSGKVYIGQTYKKNLNERWGSNGCGYKNCGAFEAAIKKYGWDNIKHEILVQGLTKTEADQAEITYIAMAKAMGISYNIRDGGTIITEADRERISKSLIGRFIGSKNPFYGHVHPNNGKIAICKGTTTKYIDEKDLDKYIDEGWVKGVPNFRKQSLSNIFRGRVWIKRGNETKQIPLECLDQYLSEGWSRGRIISEKWCKPCTDDKKQKISAKNKGGVYINNGSICKHIRKEELDQYLADGWIKGHLKKPEQFKEKMFGRFFVNKNGNQKMVKPEELDQYLADGWIRGRK